MSHVEMPRCPKCWSKDKVFMHAHNEFRCETCHERFDKNGERMHDWQFYGNGSFCRRCGASIGSPYSCR